MLLLLLLCVGGAAGINCSCVLMMQHVQPTLSTQEKERSFATHPTLCLLHNPTPCSKPNRSLETSVSTGSFTAAPQLPLLPPSQPWLPLPQHVQPPRP